MSEIKCPNCGKTFAVDESGYTELVKLARDEEFERQLAAHVKQVESAAKAREQAAAAKASAKLSEAVTAKDAEIATLRAQLESNKEAARAEVQLAKRQAADAQAEALLAAERERDQLKVQIAAQSERFQAERDLAVSQAEQRAREHAEEAQRKLRDQLTAAESARSELKAQLDAQAGQAQLNLELAVQGARAEAAEKAREAEAKSREAMRAIERERDQLKSALDVSRVDAQRAEEQHKNELATRAAIMQEQIDARDREIDNIKHMRAELSVKMIGESLEQFCENEFNKLRATAFQTAYFQKDNDAAEGSKGDYIYRECDEDGNEIVSIMFEMKNEADDSTHRKRNEDHFAKLNRDRQAKKCEYAVLVSLLERDNDFYNTGIVDVSFTSGFEKMYVIRPQFFIPMITLIRNAAMRSAGYRRELAEVRQQNIDVTHFEDQLDDFKNKFGRNCDLASRKFQAAIKDINDTIKKLEKIRDELTSSDNNLRHANNKLDGLTVKRLTRKNPTMKAAFEEARAAKEAGTVPAYQPEPDWSDLVEVEPVGIEDVEPDSPHSAAE